MSAGTRRALKRALAAGHILERRLAAGRGGGQGTTILIYHRVGGGSGDEMDLSPEAFAAQVEVLARHRVVALDAALDELAAGDDSPKVVVTFDDGFSEVSRHAWPLLAEAGVPATIYLTTGRMGAPMVWDGRAGTRVGRGLSWDQLAELADSELVTIGNHTHDHVRPDRLDATQLDRASSVIEERLGVTPRHFAYPWGIRVPAAEPLVRDRFRSAVTGELGRNHPGTDPHRLRRVPVRASDPIGFFEAKLVGDLLPERVYAGLVGAAKALGVGG